MKSFVENLEEMIEEFDTGEDDYGSGHDIIHMVWRIWEGSQEQADSLAAEEKRTAPEPKARPAFRFDP